MEKKIEIDIDNSHFVLSGDVDNILKDRMFLVSLRRMNFEHEGNVIKIPFEEGGKIFVLKEIQDLLERYDFSSDLQDSVKREESAYNKEREDFKIRSEKARRIRNKDLTCEEEKEFEDFKNLLSEKAVRRFYDLQLLSAYHLAFSWHSCNFSVPGSGKTSIVYAAYIYLKQQGFVDRILVVGPLSSFAPWENEYRECFGEEVKSQRLSGDASISRGEKEQHLYSETSKELTLVSHQGMLSFGKEMVDFIKRNKVMVVIDEAHKIKNPDGRWGSAAVEIAKEAAARVILTGTPVPNGYEDLYNLFQFLYPFTFEDILEIHYGQLKDMTKNTVPPEDESVQAFVKRIQPYFLRIKKSDLHLPPVQEKVIPVKMDKNQREIYDFIEEEYVDSFRLNSSATVKDVLNKAKLIRLRQAATNPSLLRKSLQDSLEISEEYGTDPNSDFTQISNESIDDSSVLRKIIAYDEGGTPRKFVKIKEILDNDILPRNEKVIIWTIFIQNAEELQMHLEENNIKTKLLIGRVLQDEREKIVASFNDPNHTEFRVVIANPFSVSESISLHKGCHNAIYMERDYNAAGFLQSKDRIHRVGLPDGVETVYYYLVSEDSIDTVIKRKLDEKVERMEKIIDEEIPLFSKIHDTDETDIIKALLEDYAKRT